MIDLRWTELSLGLSLLFTISYCLYVALYFRKCVQLAPLRKNNNITGIVLFSLYLIIFVSTNSSSDWYSYQDLVWSYDLSQGAYNYGEPIYRYIVWMVDRNYLAFRIVVWGGAFLLVCLSFKRFDLNIRTAVFFFVVVFLVKFNYARASLAAACYFFGISILIKPLKSKIVSYLTIGVFFILAYEFHRSLLPILLFTFAALIPLEKKYIAIPLLIGLPLIASFIMQRVSYIGLLGSDYLIDKVEGFMEEESGEATTFGIVAEIIMYSPFLISFVMTSLAFVKNNKMIIAKQVRHIYRITLTTVLFAVSFLFMGLPSNIFTYRYLFLTAIPLAILSVFLYQNKLMKKSCFVTIIIFGIISNLYPLLYGLCKLM